MPFVGDHYITGNFAIERRKEERLRARKADPFFIPHFAAGGENRIPRRSSFATWEDWDNFCCSRSQGNAHNHKKTKEFRNWHEERRVARKLRTVDDTPDPPDWAEIEMASIFRGFEEYAMMWQELVDTQMFQMDLCYKLGLLP